MSWQLGAFGVLALALAGGFAWYERRRPDARIVALVGTLAAFAALGRIAFAAVPNVKPTTDIVLISGFALGGPPGFVVGALAGLTSNFFFGQGPWTPWQMAAWGVTGLVGAGLALATRRRISRWPLALVCAVVGFCFAAVQDVGDWVTYSDHSVAQLGVYVSKGIGFDLVHAAGCLLFALAFGPALVHSVARFAARLQVSWRTAASGTLPLIAALLAVAAIAPAPARAATPTDYLLSAQNADGGFGAGPGQPSDPLFSGWAALGLAAEGHNPGDVARGGRSLLDYIQAGASTSADAGSLERTILALRAAGFPASGLVSALEGRFRRNGSVANQVNLTAFAVLALRGANIRAPARTMSWLVHQQNSDGGFSFATAGGASDVDDTGAALQALAGTGAFGQARARASAFIRRQQNRDGGLPSQPGGPSNAQSTAWATQGLLAAGIPPATLHRRGASSPLQYLSSLIAADGHLRYSSGSDQTPVWVTAQAAMALASKILPLAPVPRVSRPKPAAHRHAARAAQATRRARRADKTRHRAATARPARELNGWAAAAGLVMALALSPVRAA